MKKRIVMSILTCMTLVLASCGSPDVDLDSDTKTEDAGEDKSKDEETKKDDTADDSKDSSTKAVTVASHKVTVSFADYEGLTSTGSYPEIIVNEDYMMEYPKFWAAMTNYSDSLCESTVEDIKYFGYGSPQGDSDSYYYDITAQVIRLDDKMFTVKIEEHYDWSYTEGYDPYYYYVNYDVNTGKRIWSDGFFESKEGIDEVIYNALIEAYPREKDLVNDTTDEGVSVAYDSIASMIEYDYLPCYIQGDQFIMHFEPYSIMYNDNEYDLSIPVDDLKDYLNQDYVGDTTQNLDDLVEYTEVTDETYEGQIYSYEDGTPEYSEQEVIHVSTVEEFLDAIAPNVHIVMEAGKYDISDYVLEPTADFLEEHPYWNYSSWWGEYGIYDVYNLTIEGEDPTDRPEIVINSPYYDVLVINSSNGITLNNLIIGHDAMKGECSANVLAIYSSNGVVGTNLDLYGCGAYGLFCSSSNGIYIYDSCIHDCTYGIVQLMDNSTDICFYNSEFINNKEYTLIENAYNYGYLYFTECTFEGNEGDLFSLYAESGYITFTDCEFGDEERQFLDEHMDMVDYYEDGAAG